MSGIPNFQDRQNIGGFAENRNMPGIIYQQFFHQHARFTFTRYSLAGSGRDLATGTWLVDSPSPSACGGYRRHAVVAQANSITHSFGIERIAGHRIQRRIISGSPLSTIVAIVASGVYQPVSPGNRCRLDWPIMALFSGSGTGSAPFFARRRSSPDRNCLPAKCQLDSR